LLLLGILADAPEVDARKPLLQVMEATASADIKAAAVECLARHGKAEDVPLLAQWAATGEAPVKAAARRSLQRISGPGVDEALIQLIGSGDIGPRKAVLEALPSRRMESALPTLVRLLSGSDPTLAAEAAKTIGQMGSFSLVPDLARVLTSTSNEGLRSATQEAIQTICTRAEDKAPCAALILAELEKAATPEARRALLPLTVYTGGAGGLAQVLQSMADNNAGVREAAFRTLVEWPEARAAGPLLEFARTNSEASLAILALRDGCLRLAEMDEVPVSDRAFILQGVSQVARRPEEKRRAVSLMGQVPSLGLLQLLPRLAADNTLRAEATASSVQLARSLAPVYPRQSLAALDEVMKQADTPELRNAVEQGIKAVRNAGQSPEGFILGWMLSGPYTAPDQDASGLLDFPFPPEDFAAKAEWRPLGASTNGIVDLGKLMPGDNRVAYLRATISSPQDQKALLELGTDDGVKVWLNGRVVHTNNAVRGCTPGEDKVNVSLKQGENLLLLKVSQGGGEWAAVARFRGPDGKPLSPIVVGGAQE
jgi:HEAT repeat protein